MSKPESSYHTVARELRSQIFQGVFDDNKRLPTEAVLARQYGVSRQTIRRSFQDLVADGLVVRTPGRGTFVRPKEKRYIRQFGSVDDLMALSTDTRMEVCRTLERQIDVSAASRLRLESDVIYEMELIRTSADIPFCVTTVQLPPRIGERIVALGQVSARGTQSQETIIGLINRTASDPIAEAQQSITAVHAEPSHGETLHCPIGTALLRIDRLYLDTKGIPVELATSFLLPEHYSYRINLRRDAR